MTSLKKCILHMSGFRGGYYLCSILAILLIFCLFTPVVTATVTCRSPCECMQEEMAMERFGNGGYVKCSEDSCGYFVNDLKIKVPMYCFKAELPYFTKNPTATPTPTPTEEYTLRPIGTITSTPTIWITATPTPAVFNTPDTDGDGIFDFLDNCPGVPNPDQVDSETEIKCVSPASVGELKRVR